MHYHMEIIMPPTDDVEAAVASIMKPFDENGEDEEGNPNRHAFWDWYQIGGRWSGSHLKARYEPERLDEFFGWLQSEKVTVSGIRFGKQKLKPSGQIQKVDAKWNEMFPSERFEPCPIFQHSGDNMTDDVCRLVNLPERITCSHIIIAGPRYDHDTNKRTGPPEAVYMVQDEIWNGVTHVKADWDGTVRQALAMHSERLKNLNPEYAALMTPSDDWLVVTVDYHS